MTSATAQDRLRQIAILVSSVDAVAARQILLHLPSETARQVRGLATKLGTVSPEEKRRILAEFQRSAVSTGSEVPASRLQNQKTPPAKPPSAMSPSAMLQPTELEFKSVLAPSSSNQVFAAGGGENNESTNAAAWTRLSTAALVRFVRGERAAVAAVVISQLAPREAVEVLQHLSAEAGREILLRLSRLQEIAPEAMAEIDQHLSQRFHEYEHRLESELENARRIDALLEAAPETLRRQWSLDLKAASEDRNPSLSGTSETLPQATDSENPMVFASGETDSLDIGGEQNGVFEEDSAASAEPASDDTDMSEKATLLPFAPQSRSHLTPLDRSLVELEFEQILQLPPQTLALLLSSTDSQTVLLALAGATPQFMRRFYRMLDRGDAKVLQNRLQRIGALHLRDVDEAQRRIVENAAKLADRQIESTVLRSSRLRAA